MKTLLPLYKIVLEKFKEGNDLFICNAIEKCKFGEVNYGLVLDHFHSQYPSETQYREFYHNKLFYKNNLMGSWFKNMRICQPSNVKGLPSFQIRLKLLEAIIAKLESEINLVD